MDKSPAYEVARRWGYLFNEEIDLMIATAHALASETPVIVNIGAGTGTSALALRSAKPEAVIYTADISPGGPEGGMKNEQNVFREFNMRLPIQLLGDSKDTGKAWDRGRVDMVFVDGNHSDDGAAGDIDAWHTHLAPGGIMAFHDYDSEMWGGLKDVIDRKMAELKYKQIGLARTLAVYRKSL